MALKQSTGKLSLLRVHDVGTKFGPPADQVAAQGAFVPDDDVIEAFSTQPVS
jgi:hypothetical protein